MFRMTVFLGLSMSAALWYLAINGVKFVEEVSGASCYDPAFTELGNKVIRNCER